MACRPSGDRCLLMKVGYTKGENAVSIWRQLVQVVVSSVRSRAVGCSGMKSWALARGW